MANVRTQVSGSTRRVLTKVVNGQRRVSCSCCEEPECCMYSATALTNGIYRAEDLPDEIVVSDGFSSWTAQRQGTNFVAEDAFASGEDIVIGLFEGEWRLWVDAGNGPEFIIGDYSAVCLINTPFSEFERNPAIQDPFEDSYSVSYSTGEIPTTSVSRINLCQWRARITLNGEPFTITLEYTDNPADEDYAAWTVNGDRKKETQNTPVGDYESDEAVWIVS